jgi:hypothetical protein
MPAANVACESIDKLRRDIVLRNLAANGRQAQARVRLSDTGIVEWQLPDTREAGAAAATARACGSWLLGLTAWPKALSPLAPLRERLRQEPPCKAWLAALPLIAAVPGASIEISDAGADGWLLIDGLLSASHEALGVLRTLLPAPEKPSSDSVRKGGALGAVIDRYLEQLNNAAEDEDAAKDARRKFLASGGKRMASILRDAGLLRPSECGDAKALEATANRIDTVCRRREDCKESRKPKAAAVPQADGKQIGGLYDAGASKRRIRTPEGRHSSRLCEECQSLPRGYGFNGAFCKLHGKRLAVEEQRLIATGERQGSWEGLAPHTLEEQRRKAAEILGSRPRAEATAG